MMHFLRIIQFTRLMSNPFVAKPEEGRDQKKLGIFDNLKPSTKPQTEYKFVNPVMNQNPAPNIFGNKDKGAKAVQEIKKIQEEPKKEEPKQVSKESEPQEEVKREVFKESSQSQSLQNGDEQGYGEKKLGIEEGKKKSKEKKRRQEKEVKNVVKNPADLKKQAAQKAQKIASLGNEIQVEEENLSKIKQTLKNKEDRKKEVEAEYEQLKGKEGDEKLGHLDDLSRELMGLKRQIIEINKEKEELVETLQHLETDRNALEDQNSKIKEELSQFERLKKEVINVYQRLADAKGKYEQKKNAQTGKQARILLKARNDVNAKVLSSSFVNEINIDQVDYDFGPAQEGEKKEDFKVEDKKDNGKTEEKPVEIKKEEKLVEVKKEEENEKIQEKSQPAKEIKEEKVIKEQQPVKKQISAVISEFQVKSEQKSAIKEEPKVEEKPQQKVQKKEPEQKEVKAEPKKEEIIPKKQQKEEENPRMNENFVQLINELNEAKEAILSKKISNELTSEQIMKRGIAKFEHFKAIRHFLPQCQYEFQKVIDVTLLQSTPQFLKAKQTFDEAKLLASNEQALLKQDEVIYMEVYDQELEQRQRQMDLKNIQEAFNEFDAKPKLKIMYEEAILSAEGRNPHFIRFLFILRKYLNQLRILIELNQIDDKYLLVHHFDRLKYAELVAGKTKLIETNKLPDDEIPDDLFTSEKWIKIMDQLDVIQAEIAPMQNNFNEQYVKGLYEVPKEMLRNTKQQLFELSLKKELEEYKKELENSRQEGKKLESDFELKKVQKEKLALKNKVLEEKKTTLQKNHKKELNQLFSPGVEQDQWISQNQYEQDYKVEVQNSAQVQKKYEELNDDSLTKALGQQLQELIRQKLLAKEALQAAKAEYFKQMKALKRKAMRQVYMGDPEKVKTNPKIKELDFQLKHMMEKVGQQSQQERRDSSKISEVSQIRISYIYE